MRALLAPPTAGIAGITGVSAWRCDSKMGHVIRHKTRVTGREVFLEMESPYSCGIEQMSQLCWCCRKEECALFKSPKIVWITHFTAVLLSMCGGLCSHKSGCPFRLKAYNYVYCSWVLSTIVFLPRVCKAMSRVQPSTTFPSILETLWIPSLRTEFFCMVYSSHFLVF